MEIERAAAACLSEGQIWDISDPLHPVTLHRLNHNETEHEEDLAVWHSGSFTWDGKVAVFGDEALPASCEAGDPSNIGAIWFYDLEDPSVPLGHFKIPRLENGTCTAHNYNIVPVPKPLHRRSPPGTPAEPPSRTSRIRPRRRRSRSTTRRARRRGALSSYWYNGKVYAGDMGRGVDVFKVQAKAAWTNVRFGHLNPQTQEQILR